MGHRRWEMGITADFIQIVIGYQLIVIRGSGLVVRWSVVWLSVVVVLSRYSRLLRSSSNTICVSGASASLFSDTDAAPMLADVVLRQFSQVRR